MLYADATKIYNDLLPFAELIEKSKDLKDAKILSSFLGNQIVKDPDFENRATEDQKDMLLDMYNKMRAYSFQYALESDIDDIMKFAFVHIIDWPYSELEYAFDVYFERFDTITTIQKQQKVIVENIVKNKQRIAKDPIETEDGRKIAPTLGNWLKYYYLQTGGTSNQKKLSVARFFSQDKNLKTLSSERITQLKNVIKLLDYIKRPADDILDLNEEFIVDFGDGRSAFYSSGTFLLDNDDPVIQTLVKDAILEFSEKENKKNSAQGNNSSLKEFTPEKQELQKKRKTILEPINSPEQDLLDDSIKNLSEQNQLQADISEQEHLQYQQNIAQEITVNNQGSVGNDSDIHPTIPENEIVTQQDTPQYVEEHLDDSQVDMQVNDDQSTEFHMDSQSSMEERIQQLYKGTPEEKEQISRYYKAVQSLNKQEIVLNVLSAVKNKNGLFLVAVLKKAADLDILENIYKDNKVLALLNNDNLDNQGTLRELLQKHSGLSEEDSARFVLHIINEMNSNTAKEYNNLAYFDMEKFSFVWK